MAESNGPKAWNKQDTCIIARHIGLALPWGKTKRAAQLALSPMRPQNVACPHHMAARLLGHPNNRTPPCGTFMVAWPPWKGSNCQPCEVTVGPSARSIFSPPRELWHLSAKTMPKTWTSAMHQFISSEESNRSPERVSSSSCHSLLSGIQSNPSKTSSPTGGMGSRVHIRILTYPSSREGRHWPKDSTLWVQIIPNLLDMTSESYYRVLQ